jgi:hypothetical protein
VNIVPVVTSPGYATHDFDLLAHDGSVIGHQHAQQ